MAVVVDAVKSTPEYPMPESEPPLTAADLAGNSGFLPEIVWRGKAYPVAYPCPKVIEYLVAYVKRTAYARLDELAKDIADNADEPWAKNIAEARATLMEQVVNREYDFTQPLYIATLKGREKAGNMLWACMNVAASMAPNGPTLQSLLRNPAVALADVARMIQEVPEAVELVNGELQRFFFAEAKKIKPWAEEPAKPKPATNPT